MSSVLHALNKLSFSGFLGFCECLVNTGQAAVVVDCLSPELHEQQQQQQHPPPLLNVDVRRQHAGGEDPASSLTLLGVVDLRPADDEQQRQEDRQLPAAAAAAATLSPVRVVDYDWKAVIRENFMQLTQHVDPDSGLLNELLSRGVVSHVSADVIKVLYTPSPADVSSDRSLPNPNANVLTSLNGLSPTGKGRGKGPQTCDDIIVVACFWAPFYGAIAVPSVTRCRCCRGHRCAGGVRQ